LSLRICCTKNGSYLGGITSAAGYGIKINHMKVSESVLSPRQRNSNGIRNADDFSIVGAGGELNTGSASQV
jgi:hypothetical protein